MGIRIIVCPQCGANYKADSERIINYCEYCGSRLPEDIPETRSVDVAYGGSRPSDKDNYELARKLGELQSALPALRMHENNAKKLTDTISKLNAKEVSLIKKRIPSIIVWPIVIILLILSFLRFATNPLVWAIFAIVSIMLFPLFGSSYVRKCKKLAIQIDRTEASLDAVLNKMDECKQIISRYPEIQIPYKFQNDRAIEFMRNTLLTGQASGLMQAIALCEEKNNQMKTQRRYR